MKQSGSYTSSSMIHSNSLSVFDRARYMSGLSAVLSTSSVLLILWIGVSSWYSVCSALCTFSFKLTVLFGRRLPPNDSGILWWIVNGWWYFILFSFSNKFRNGFYVGDNLLDLFCSTTSYYFYTFLGDLIHESFGSCVLLFSIVEFLSTVTFKYSTDHKYKISYYPIFHPLLRLGVDFDGFTVTVFLGIFIVTFLGI